MEFKLTGRGRGGRRKAPNDPSELCIQMKRSERLRSVGLEIEARIPLEPFVGDLCLFDTIHTEAAQGGVSSHVTRNQVVPRAKQNAVAKRDADDDRHMDRNARKVYHIDPRIDPEEISV